MSNGTPQWMQLDVERRPQALLDDIAGSVKISPTIQKLMDLTRRPDGMINPVVETLATSPSIAAEVLKVANCPIYAHNKEIVDLKRAVVLIGMQELHAMASGLSMLAMFSSENEISATMRDTSVVSATIARQLAAYYGEDPVNAFLCGLLCEIGALACNHKDADGYIEIWKKSNHAPPGRFRLESARYGVPTEATGGRLLSLNGLPRTVADAVKVSYAEAASTSNTLGKITCFSRFAAYVLVDAGALSSREVLEEGIRQLADHMAIHKPSVDVLIKLCLNAGMQANLGLRDQVDLYKETLELQNEISRNIDVAAGAPVAGASQKSPHKRGGHSTLLVAGLSAAVIAVAIILIIALK